MFSRVRQLAIGRFFALCVVALILLPFTAPFKTYDLAVTRGSGALDGLPKDKTDSDEKVLGPTDGSLVPPALTLVVIAAGARSSQLDEPPLPPTILRI